MQPLADPCRKTSPPSQPPAHLLLPIASRFQAVSGGRYFYSIGRPAGSVCGDDCGLDILGWLAGQGLVDLADDPLCQFRMVVLAHLAQRLGIGDDQQRLDLSGHRLGVEPFGRGGTARQFIQLCATKVLADFVLMAYACAEIGPFQLGLGNLNQLGLENLPLIAEQGEIFAVKQSNMGLVR